MPKLYHRRLSRFVLAPLLYELRHLEITLWHKRGAGGKGAGAVAGGFCIAQAGQNVFTILRAGGTNGCIAQAGH